MTNFATLHPQSVEGTFHNHYYFFVGGPTVRFGELGGGTLMALCSRFACGCLSFEKTDSSDGEGI